MNPLGLARQVCTVENHTFLTGPLVRGGAVIDAGANVGGFAGQLVARYPVHVYSLEPHPEHFARIATPDRVRKFNLALAGHDGTRRLAFSSNPQGSRLTGDSPADGTDVIIRGLESFAAEHGLSDIALVKLDIEGAEVEVLDSLTEGFLARVDQFTIEFHDFAGYLTTAQVEAALRRLERFDFAAIKFSRVQYGDTLVVNRRRLDIGAVGLATLRHAVRNARGVVRWLRRPKRRPAR